MLTKEEMQALRAPFGLNEHTVREGFRNKAKTKIRWFVYIDRSAIADRLDDMFLGDWGMAEPQIHIQDKKVSAVVGITIRGVTRYDGGEDDSDEGTKGALTNAFRRTAAYGWGMARYLYDMDFDIWTDAYKDGDWDDMRAKKDEAFKKFTEWYRKRFSSVGTPTPTPPAPQPAASAPPASTPESKATGTPAGAENGANGAYRVNNFQVQLTSGRVPQPYLIFSIDEINAYAYAFTRQPFKDAGYDVDNWKAVGNHEMPCPAEITVEQNKEGKYVVKSAKMIDIFADSMAS